jgi:hypothetical protein
MFNFTHITLEGIAGGLLSFIGRLGWKTVQKDRRMVADIHQELTLQRTNCLTTLQEQGERQVELLEKIDEKLADQNGFIRGYLEGKSHDA